MLILRYQFLLLLLAALSRVDGQLLRRLPCEQEVCAEDTKQVGCVPLWKSKVCLPLYIVEEDDDAKQGSPFTDVR